MITIETGSLRSLIEYGTSEVSVQESKSYEGRRRSHCPRVSWEFCPVRSEGVTMKGSGQAGK